eukprot:1146964-Pelagomonas_calceolata.AAC.6
MVRNDQGSIRAAGIASGLIRNSGAHFDQTVDVSPLSVHRALAACASLLLPYSVTPVHGNEVAQSKTASNPQYDTLAFAVSHVHAPENKQITTYKEGGPPRRLSPVQPIKCAVARIPESRRQTSE